MAKHSYLRDGRAPVPVDARVSEQMSRIRSKNTGPERMLRKALTDAGIRGYRLNYAKAAGKPDVAFVGRKVAVFIHGCFWHCCPHCQPRRPKTHRDFWEEKLDRNVQRDERNVRALRKAAWRVVTIWECRMRKFPESQVRRVERVLERQG
ncbi:MAG TPA: very short patch repair endonuclease [Flavobacteriales bacterium]|nr:very short patch repair endonuclease [Flavobacteriales bacterium]HRP81693.1 very short patch repair endonuclease [Flavobacteriales bacterium]HRQ84939.1 very short patch repair endonuclease [Flavobacteriales bacterium]